MSYISSAAMTVFDLSLVLEHSSARMPFKLSYFIELLLTQLMVLWSSAELGHIMDHHQLTHCLPYGTCWWASGECHTKIQLLIWMSPLGHQTHQLSFQIGLVKSSTYF